MLVTAAAGYIGQAAVKSLLDRGAQVTAVDVRQENIDPRAEFRHLDLFQDDPEVFQHLGCPDVCLHMAWRNGFVHNAPSHMEDVSAHVRFLRQMMEGGLKQLAVMGTMHEVGYHEGAITEDTPCNPQSMYGIAKNALRQTCELLAAQHGAQLQWLRAYYIIGNDEKSNSIFAKILQAAQEGKTTFPLNSGKNRYDFIDLAELGEQLGRLRDADGGAGHHQLLHRPAGEPGGAGGAVHPGSRAVPGAGIRRLPRPALRFPRRVGRSRKNSADYEA